MTTKTTNQMLPPSFDAAFYRKDKPFLESDAAAYNHFNTEGKKSGFKGSPGCDQGYLLNFLRSLQSDAVLEIGPGCSPKFKGRNVFYFDVKSRAELLDRYKDEASVSGVPDDIHYVNQSGDLGSIDKKFDVIFSSHAIEHSADLIQHLSQVALLLKPDGIYVVVAPNKNFTFDYFKPLSTAEEVISSHLSGRHSVNTSIRAVLTETIRRTHNDPTRHWANDHGEMSFDKHKAVSALANIDRIIGNDIAMSGYHKWVFTDESFAEVINMLHELGIIPLRVRECYNTPYGGMSFTAILGRA
jgi:SAM-dependent methyltransferase